MRNLIPAFIAKHYLERRFQGSFRATCMVVDVSGFSKMTDVLAEHGQHGAEVLAEVMQAVFDPLAESVYGRNGFIVGFAGDAFTALFHQDAHLGSAAERAIAAAITIQKRLSAFVHATPYGEFKISVKIGLGKGEVRWQIIENSEGKNATFYFRGTAIERAVKAELCATAGEILVDSRYYQELQTKLQGTWRSEQIFQVSEYVGKWPNFTPPQKARLDEKVVSAFWPEAIVHLKQNGEFRPAVNVFIGIPPALQSKNGPELLLKKVLELQERYGGLLSRPDFGDKGFNLLLFWGVPITQENDIERALNFVLDLQTEMNCPLKAGITYRTSYAGFMGSALREDYTCYGWGINLAARIMTSAKEGEILVDGEIARRAARKFKFQPIGERVFKGFARPQTVFKFLGRKDKIEEAVFSGSFYGREKEIERLSQFIAPIWSGKFAGMFTIRGDAGLGKSRLVYEFRNSSLFSDKNVLWAICQTDEIIRQSLNPFRYWLKTYLNISDNKKDETRNKRKFEQKIEELMQVTRDPELMLNLDRGRSFLGSLLNLHWPDSPYEQLDAQSRYENTLVALSTFLRAESLQRPVILFIEDIHWLDEDSKAFLNYFSRVLAAEPQKNYPVAILATSRPQGTPLQMPASVPNEILDLAELPHDSINRLVQDLLGGQISPALLQLLHQRAEGNPFFAEQIIRYLQDEQLIRFEKDQWQLAWQQAPESLPADVRTVLIARLDRLKQEVREVVQTASVLGREFEVRLLAHMLSDRNDLGGEMAEAVQADIWAPQSEDHYLFRHALMRDTAYNMQLHTRQKTLHQLALGAFESVYRDDLTPYYGQLAHHAEQAGLAQAACKYLTLAGKIAANAYQNNQAINYFSRALVLTPPNELRQRFDLLLERAKVYYRIGERDAQARDLERLETLAQQLDEQAILDTLVRRAYYSFAIGDFPLTADFSQRAATLATAIENNEAALDAYTVWPLALLRLGELDEAMEIAQKGLDLAQRLGKRAKEGHIYNSMGLIAFERALPASQTYFENALLIAHETQDRHLEGRAANNLGNVAAFLHGDYLAAREYYQQAYQINRERDDRATMGMNLSNLGWVSALLGDFPLAVNYYTKALEIVRESGNPYHLSYLSMNLGMVLALQGESETALHYVKEANEITRRIGERAGEAWSLFYLGQILLARGEYQQAQKAFEDSMRIRQELNLPVLVLEALAGIIESALQANDIVTAQQGAEKILTFLENGGNLQGTEEPLRIYLACYHTLEKTQDSRCRLVLHAAIDILSAQIAKINREEMRRQFIDNLPWRREIYQIWANKQQKQEQEEKF